MKLSVFFDTTKNDGGAYHQNIKTVELLNNIKNIELTIISPNEKTINFFKAKNIRSVIYHFNFIDRFFYFVYSSNFLKLFFKKINLTNKFEKFLKKNQINLIYFINIEFFIRII